MRRPNRRDVVLLVAAALISLALATAVVAVLEGVAGLGNASSVYLVAVVVAALVSGTSGAIVTSVASVVIYDFLFTSPYLSLTIDDPDEWLSAATLLFVGIVVGQLTALLRLRAMLAQTREREARTLFQVSRALATRESTLTVLPSIAAALVEHTSMERAWIALGADEARERVVADTVGEAPPAPAGRHRVLRRMPGDEPAQWVRVHAPVGRATRPVPRAPAMDVFRVRIDAGATSFGSIWALRRPGRDEPDRTETRLLAAAADQIGQVLALDRLAADAQAAEVARQSDALKSALLQTVSHDLRTPLATIRAAAGTIRASAVAAGDASALERDRLESAEAIDREVEYLNRLVTNLLDLSRVEAGSLRAERDVFALDDLLGPTIERARGRLGDRPLSVDVGGAPPVEVDPTFLDAAVTNALDNAAKHTPPGTAVRITARRLADGGHVRISVEDGGPGVPDELLPRLFEKFYRAPGGPRRSRSGSGIGLTVARGLVEAMGGHVAARRSELGGLAIDLDVPLAIVPAEFVTAP